MATNPDLGPIPQAYDAVGADLALAVRDLRQRRSGRPSAPGLAQNHDPGGGSEDDPDRIIECFELERRIAAGQMAWRLIADVSSAWQARVAEGQFSVDASFQGRLEDSYRHWIAITEEVLNEAGDLSRVGLTIRGFGELSILLEEAHAILESSEIEEEMRPFEEILPLVRGNPRPDLYGL